MDYLKRLQERRNGLLESVRSTLDVAADADIDLTDAESEKIKADHEEIRGLDLQISELAELAERETVAIEERKSAGTEEIVRPIVVKNEERTYNPDGKNNFLMDAYSAHRGNPAAIERIRQHNHEEQVERRDIGTSAMTGLVVPQYLVDLVAPKARAGRPYAEICDKQPLPADGMTINISKITTGTATAIQATENSSIQETNADDSLLTVDVRSIAGAQDLSRQLLERGTPGLDRLIFADLVSAYHAELDRGVLNDLGTSGTHKGVVSASGINTVTYTDVSPTVDELFPKIADAIQKINSNRFLPATHVIMHPRRWAFFTAGVDSSKRPLVVPQAYSHENPVGVGESAGYGFVGSILGLPVITDANIATTWSAGASNTSGTEDYIVIQRSADVHLWEDQTSPIQARFEDVGSASLTVKLVAYGFSAYTAERYPASVSLISGTGLVTPTF